MSRRTVLGLCLLCGLALGAIPPATASAAAQWVTCAPSGGSGKQFADEHCITPEATGSGGFKHVAISFPTAFSFTNGKTASATTAAAPSKWKGKISGVETEVTCTTVAGSGTLENTEEKNSGGTLEKVAKGSGALNYSGCSVTKPAGKSCVVKEGKINTEELKVSSLNQEAGTVDVSPAAGGTLANITIESCTIGALNNTFPVTGSFKVAPSGATWATIHAIITLGGTFKLAGQAAGIEGATTLVMTGGNPITIT